ncbi:MAG: bifunctional lysylphosphatidylglycerol flippase/synthetase MprF [Nevskia sp.]
MTAPPREYKTWLLASITVLVFGAALWVLQRSLSALSLADVLANLRAVPLQSVLAACLCTAGSYGMLTFYDYLALRGVSHALSWPRVVPTSLIAFGIGHSVGISSISGGSIRYRDYSAAGVPALKIAGVVALVSITFVLGIGTLLGLSLIVASGDGVRVMHLQAWEVQGIGVAILGLVTGYALLTRFRRSPIHIGKRNFTLPPFGLTLLQIAVASIDLCFAAGTLFVLLPDSVALNYFGFVGLFVLAIYAGTLSNVPGGLGVFETVLILLLPGAPPEAVLGSVLLYRLVYYLLPFVLAIALLGIRTVFAQRHYLQRFTALVQDWIEPFAPQAIAAAVFLAGTVLLVSGATPAIGSRLEWLADVLPLEVLEVSHLVGSAVGVALLILARGLYQRLDGAWWLTLILLVAGILASLLKGFDYEEAALLATVLAVLLIAHERFYRRAPLLDLRYSRAWIIAFVFVVGSAVWVSVLSYQDVQFSREMWWQFAFDDDAPRVMRAGVLSLLLAAVYMLWLLLSPSRPEPRLPDAEDLERAATIAIKSTDTIANLALLGDKQLLFHEAGDAFIMYQRSGRSLIALGDPAGNPARFEQLGWKFRELCDQNAGWPVFYQVSAEQLPLYLDLGLALAKLGEEARVFLPKFSLDGPQRRDLRNEYRRAQRDGASFVVLTPGEVETRLAELRAISDDWLHGKSVAEKGFSVGRFDADYLRRFSCACVMRDGHIVAFANLWLSRSREEFSIDLMRYNAKAPKGVMDYLFIELMLWGRREDYRWFNLGMAPLSGLEKHPLAPFWHKLGRLVHRYGEPFYNFEGLRRYKEKFGPEWRPRYMASPGGLILPRVILDTAALIAGGVKEVVWKS